MEPIELELYCLAIVVLTLISICTYRVAKFFKTPTRNATIFFLCIWVFSLITVLLGLAGNYAPFHSAEAVNIFRFAGSSTAFILFSMIFFANSVLYGGIIKGKKATLIVIYVLAECAIIVTLYLTVPTSFIPGQTFNNITYQFSGFIALAYVPMVLPIIYVFINMERADPPNKGKYRLYLIGFICALVELAMDIPGTMPDFTFVWRLFALVAMVLNVVALLLPKAQA